MTRRLPGDQVAAGDQAATCLDRVGQARHPDRPGQAGQGRDCLEVDAM